MRRPAIYLSLFAFLVLAYIITQQNWHNEYEMERTYELETQVGRRVVLTFPANPTTGYRHMLLNRGRLTHLDFAGERFVAQYALLWGGQAGGPSGYRKFVFHAVKPGTDTLVIINCRRCAEELLKPEAEQELSKSTFIVHVGK